MGKRLGGKEFRTSEERLRAIIEQSPLAIHVFTPDGTSLLANAAWDRLWDIPSEESSEGMNVFDDRQIRAAGLIPYIEEGADGNTVTTPYLLYTPSRSGLTGDQRWLRAFCHPVKDKTRKTREVTLIIEDVTERKRLEDRLAYHAFHDELTGLANRTLLTERLEHAFIRADAGRNPGEKLAVLYTDLDNFKHINDSLGHESGDALLVEVAERLKGSLRPQDTVARQGGDEFVVLLEDVTDEQAASVVADRVAEVLKAPFFLGGREVFVTTSTGVAVSGAGGSDPDSLLRSADIAMYRAKKAGKNRHVLFTPSMDGRSSKRLALDSDLRQALERSEFTAMYQPQIHLSSGRTVGYEALVRWDHPERGRVLPHGFLPLAEETGLVVPVGYHVLRKACWWLQRCHQRDGQEDGPLPRMWVNLSARQLREPGLVKEVSKTLEETGLEAGRLGFEVTESAAMDGAGLGVEYAVATLRSLRDLGVEVALDDFGTGYSSLSYLKRLPIDVLKIDRSFVSGLGDGSDKGDLAIVSAVLTIARDMELSVVAEGVETEEQLTYLAERGCEMVQGFYLARPIDDEKCVAGDKLP